MRLVCLLLVAFAGVRPAAGPPPSQEASRLQAALQTIHSERIAADLHFIAGDPMRGRDTPSLELRVAARFLRARLERLGFQPGAGESFFHEYDLRQIPQSTWQAPLPDSNREGEEPAEPILAENVCGLWPGNDPVLAKEWIILSAHYDHIGARGEAIFNGADDNGSGSVGLLALAEALVEYGPLRRSVLLIWVSGEEKGLWGSAAWTRAPTLPPGARAVCNLNMDMIGRNAPDELLITPTRSHPAYNGLTRLAEKLGPREGFLSLGSADAYWLRSDQVNFARNLKIPVAFLFAGEHEDYHRATDTSDKVDYDKVRRVTRLVLRMLHALQGSDLSL